MVDRARQPDHPDVGRSTWDSSSQKEGSPAPAAGEEGPSRTGAEHQAGDQPTAPIEWYSRSGWQVQHHEAGTFSFCSYCDPRLSWGTTPKEVCPMIRFACPSCQTEYRVKD